MPYVGGVYVPDTTIPQIDTPTPRASYGQLLSNAASETVNQVRYGVPYAIQKLAGGLTPEQEQAYQSNLGRPSAIHPASVDDVTGGKVGVGRFIAENLIGSLPYMAGSVAGGVAGYAAGGAKGVIPGMIIGGTPQFAGSNVDRAVQEQGGLSQKSAALSLATAPLQAASDAYSEGVVGRALPGLGKIFGAMEHTGGFVSRTAKAMARVGATEAVTEAAQQLGERNAAGLPVTGSDATKEYVNAAVTAFAVGGVLGSLGGIRRSPAVMKPANEVTSEDLDAHISAVLHPELLALPPPEAFGRNSAPGETLALPSPEMFGRSSQGPAVGTGPVIAAENPTNFITDSAGNTLPAGPEAQQDLLAVRNQPVQPPTITDAVRAILEQGAPPASPALSASTSLSRGLQGTQLEGLNPDVQPETAALEALRNQGASAQVETLAPQVAPTALPEAPFDEHLDELKKGLRGGFVQSVTATDELDLANKVYDQIFTEQDTRSNTRKFAQRLGILDEKGNPGPLGQLIEEQRAEEQAQVAAKEQTTAAALQGTADALSAGAVAAPLRIDPRPALISPEVEAEMAAARRAAKIENAVSSKGLDTPEQVFQALATDSNTSGSSQATQIERLAQELGLITKDDARDVTPKGRQVYLNSGAGLDAAVNQAQSQGYTGKQASMFERGVRTVVQGKQSEVALTDTADFEAHQAGVEWAKQFIQRGDVKTAAQTAALLQRTDAQKAGKTASAPRVTRDISPAEIKRKAQYALINSADMTGIPDPEQAALRRMVADGTTSEELGAAIQKLQGGDTIRQAPARPAQRPETFGRGQPVLRQTLEFVDSGPQGRSAQRAETDVAVRAYDLRNLIQMARAENAMTQARADKLHTLLDEGKVDQVERLVKDFDENAKPRGKTAKLADSRNSLSGANDAAFEQAISGKTFLDATKHMAENAPSPFYRELMTKVRTLGQMLEKHGMELELRIVSPNDGPLTGSVAPAELDDAGTKAVTHLQFQPTARATVYLKNVEHGPDAAMNYTTAAHEMVHAVSMLLYDYGQNPEQYGKTELGKAAKELDELLQAVRSHFLARQSSGKTLTEFEQRVLAGDNNILHDAHELLAWGLTNPEMQSYLNSIYYKPRQTVFSRLVEAVRSLLGLEVRHDGALAHLLLTSERIFGAPKAELQGLLSRNNPGFDAQRQFSVALRSETMDARNRTAEASSGVTRAAADMLVSAADKISIRELGTQTRRKILGWLSTNQIVRQYGHLMPGLMQYVDAHRERVAVRSRLEQMGDGAVQRFDKLERTKPNMAKTLGELMATATEFQLDPSKTWEQHEHLKGHPNEAALKQLHTQALDMRDKLRRGDGAGWAMFNEFRALNEAQNYARLAASLHNLVALDPELSLGVRDADVNPVDMFMREQGLSTPEAIRDHWKKLLQEQLTKSQDFVDAKRGEAAQGTDAELRAANDHLAPIEMNIDAIGEALKGMRKAPYFHLGRYGDYFGSATVRKINGVADAAAVEHVGKALAAKGFTDVQISTDNTRPRIALRFVTLDQAHKFQEVMDTLGRQGLLDEGWNEKGHGSEARVGPRSRGDYFGTSDGPPAYVQRYIEAIESSPTYTPDPDMTPNEVAALEHSKQEAIRLARDTWLDMQPDSSISRVLTRRYAVPGYNSDMVRNWAQRWRVGSISLANVASMPKFNEAFVSMRSQVEGTSSVVDAAKYNDITTEMKARNAQNPVNELATTFDKARAFAHAYFLGLSPAYGLINMTQLGVTALPELAKVHGYAKSFHAMRRASSIAFKVLKAATNEAVALGPKHYADVAITESVLDKAGLSQSEKNFAMAMLATGTIDIGSAARSLAQVAESRTGSKTDIALRYASAMGLYTETFSRLTTALAARDLHGDKPAAEAYAAKVVSHSMFDYQTWNTARQMGKQGFAGPVTPIVTQFMSYSVQMTEKLYSEATDVFAKARPGESEQQAAERRAGARRFLAGHLTAVTALAGTLGMPFATVFAAVLDRLFGSDDEPLDVTASWRGFLSDVLGKDMGEIVARGLPRAAGFDLSQRAGEQSLLPFSEFLADHRSWKEAMNNSAGRGIGAVPSMIQSILDGGDQIANGDVLSGMKAMLPVAFKSPVEVYRMTTDGYVDTKGNKLPLTPKASDYLWQLIGFSPAAKAEYQEARQDQQVRRGDLTRRANSLRQHIVQRLVVGDTEGAKALISDAQAFDQANPDFAVVPSLAGALTRQAQARARAQALQTPIGVSMQDIAGQDLTRYANVNIGQ